MTREARSPVVVVLLGLSGAVVGATVIGSLAAGVWYLFNPNPEGLEGLAVIVVTLLGGAIGSYPGAVLGVWLGVRGRDGARTAVLWTAALYPLVGLVPVLGMLGLGGAGLVTGLALAVAAGAGAWALATRR
ncbi:MAG: hypothetical protein WD770_01405 [Actinomycetota bacterium]